MFLRGKKKKDRVSFVVVGVILDWKYLYRYFFLGVGLVEEGVLRF